MRTKKVVEQSGLDRETLRFYEQKGLIEAPLRTTGGYRDYSADVLDRIRFIQQAKRAGFTLLEITELIRVKGSGITCGKGRKIATEKLEVVRQKIRSLEDMERTLKNFVKACESKGTKGLAQKCHLSFEQFSPKSQSGGKCR